MTHRKRLLVGAAFGVVGALVAASGLVFGNFSARGYVQDHYTRASSRDLGRDGLAYTSKLPPSRVAEEVTKAWSPADKYVDGSGVYLRYGDDSVVIRPLAAGSLILLEDMATASSRYRSTVGNSWGGSRGSTVRGGGPGAGK